MSFKKLAISLLLSLLLSFSMAMAADFAAQGECPVCKIKFATISAEEIVAEKAMDGRPLGSKILPLSECPLCGGVFADEAFSDSELKRIESFIWSTEFQKSRQTDTWFRHAILLENLERSDKEVALAFLKASWAAEHDLKLQQQYQEKSLLLLQRCLENSEADPGEQFEVNLKIADLLRQLKRFVEARARLLAMQQSDYSKHGYNKVILRHALALVDTADNRPAPFPAGNRLHLAIAENDSVDFVAAMSDRALLDEPDKNGLSPLILAIKMGRQSFVEKLLAAGADFQNADVNGKTPLHWAVMVNSEELVAWLVNKNATINCTDAVGQTPLHLSLTAGNENIIKSLLNAGADVNARDRAGNTLLHLLAQQADGKAPHLFLSIRDRFADLDQRNFADLTALHIAARIGNKGLLIQLVKAGANVNSRLPDGSNVLFFCRPDLTGLLQDLGANTELKNNAGQSAFVYARLAGDIERVHFFKQTRHYGTKAREFSIGSESLSIFTAVKAGHQAAVTQILQLDSRQISVKDLSLGETPLHTAVAAGNLQMVKLLLNSGAAVNAESDFLRTPLHYASSGGNIDMVKLLCAAGANVYALDARGSTPLHDAAAAQNRRIYSFLIGCGASDSTVDNAGQPASALLDPE